MQSHPLFRPRRSEWMLDTTLPDGTMAPIDDGNPGRSYYFGALPSDLPDTAAALLALGRHAAAARDRRIGRARARHDRRLRRRRSRRRAPWWSPTQFYVEGGTAIAALGRGSTTR